MARQMKDSGVEWIGQIPAEWKRVKLKEVTNIIMGQSPEAQDIKDFGNIPFMQGNREFGSIYPNAVKFCDNSPKKSRIGDILLSVRAPVGAINVSDKVYAIGRGLCSICATSINSKFLMYFLMLIMQDTKKFGQGSTFDAITIQELKQLPVLLPPINTQNRIASYLDRKCAQIDAIIAKQQHIIEKLKEYKLSVITEAVTKGLDPNVPMKDSGVEWIGKIPEHWNILKLQAHTRMLTPMRDRPEKLDGDIPWVRIEDYDGKYISTSKEGLGVSLETVNEMNLKIYPVGSILCTSSCDLGKCAIVTRELVSNQRFINIIPDLDTNSDYLYYLMLSNAKRLNHLSTGTIQANLSRKAFEHLMVQFPPFAEQKEIAEYLDKKCETVELSIRKKQELIDRLNLYKKSLIYETVTGKKEI